jgi:pilus assembly protein FimV
VQGKVEDKSTAKAAPDKLTLSKGAVAKQSAEDQLAKQRSAKEAANRATELSKNISDLSKLGAASSAAAPMSAAQPASALAAVATAASAAVARAAGSSPVSAPAAKRPAAVPAPAEELGLIDELLANPLLPAGAVGLMVLLAALGFYKVWQRKKGAAGGTDALKDSLRPDSFFGASGGQSVDTSDSSVATGSSIVFSASQMDAADEVDPVAEADVYLAYGRDQQAEEILKDALRINPGRVAIHQKLLELYAKRRDVKAFESIAALAFKATKGQGAQWEHICDLGKTVDADNPLYQPGGEPNRLSAATTVPGSLDDTKSRTDSSATAAEPAAGAASGASVDLDMDLDLDLDFSLDEESAGAAGQTTGSVEGALSAFLDLDVSMPAPLAESSGAPEAAASADSNAIEFTLPAVEIEQSEALAQASAEDEGAVQPTAVPAPPNLDMLDFDMGSLSLDLEEPANPESGTEAMAQEDPLATKLALAEEFRAIGDDDGARALIEEVMAEALGDMKVKAERALTRL